MRRAAKHAICFDIVDEGNATTDPVSNAGIPGLTIPAGLGPTTGMPVGLSLDGPSGGDERLLALGLTIEKILGRTPPPPVR